MDKNLMKEIIADFVRMELNQANEIYPLFNSIHEAFGVLKEEVEEAGDDYINLIIALDRLWEIAKSSKGHPHTMDGLNEKAIISLVTFHSTNMILELIQVIAMVEKWKQSFEFEEGDEFGENEEKE